MDNRDCIFCKITRGESPANFVYESDDFVIFHNIIAEQLNIADRGYKLIINVGSGGGQGVFHLHIYLVGGWGR